MWSYNDLAQGAEYSLTESALSPFQAEPTQTDLSWMAEGNAVGPETLLSSGPQVSDSTCSIFVVFDAQNHMFVGNGHGFCSG